MLQLKCPAQNYAWGRKAGRNNGKIGSTVMHIVFNQQILWQPRGSTGLDRLSVYSDDSLANFCMRDLRARNSAAEFEMLLPYICKA